MIKIAFKNKKKKKKKNYKKKKQVINIFLTKKILKSKNFLLNNWIKMKS